MGAPGGAIARAAPGARHARASISNLSRNGLFVATPDVPTNGTCLLVIPTLGDEAPIPGEVRWSMPWGASMQVLPGFGVRCLSLTPRQQADLEKQAEPAS